MRLSLLAVAFAITWSHSVGSHSQEYSTGLIPVPEEVYNSFPAAAPLRGPMPGAVSLAQYFPPPQSQGKQNSCAGWAVAYTKAYQENVERVRSGNNPVMYSPSFIYNQIKVGAGCDGGSSLVDALNLVVRVGAVNIYEFGYDAELCNKLPDQRALGIATRTKALHWATIKTMKERLDVSKVQNYLVYGVPVIVGARIDDNFHNHRLSRGMSTFRDFSGRTSGRHAMVIIGFDTNRAAFRLINSWGVAWGDGGYVWVDYDTMASMVDEAYVLYDTSSDQLEWQRYQQCLRNGQQRCCDHISSEFAVAASLCTALPGLNELDLYNWCASSGGSRCCDHLSQGTIRANNVRACGA